MLGVGKGHRPVQVAAVGPADREAVQALARAADWHYEHFEMPGAEAYTWPGYLARDDSGRLLGALGCWIDRPPVASILYAVLDRDAAPIETMGALLEPNERALRLAHATELTFVGRASWLARHLRKLGFVQQTTVISYWRTLAPDPGRGQGDVAVAGPLAADQGQDVAVRPAQEDDADAVAAIDRAAFEPIWRYPAVKHRSMIQEMACFLLAEADGSVIGYQATDIVDGQGVVVRLAVAPAYQRAGVGTRLLTEGLRFVQLKGIVHVTLNTQANNQASRRLYARLGFAPFGDEVPALLKPLV